MKLIQRIAVFTIAVAMLTGCESSTPKSGGLGAILADLTPELQGYQERPIDVKRNLAIVNNANLRGLSDDLGRTFYTNHPSRLTPYPVMSLSGNPW